MFATIGLDFLILKDYEDTTNRGGIFVATSKELVFPPSIQEGEWVYNTIVSGGKSYKFDTDESIRGEGNVLGIGFSMNYQDIFEPENEVCVPFCVIEGPRHALWGKNMGMYVFLLRIIREKFRRDMPIYGIPDELLLAKSDTSTCINHSDMDMIERFYSRCIVCCNCWSETTNFTRKDISATWCIPCLQQNPFVPGPLTDPMFHMSSTRLLLIECLLSKHVKWYSVDNDRFDGKDMFLCCIMESKIATVVTVVDRTAEDVVLLRYYKKDSIPLISPFTCYPQRPKQKLCRVSTALLHWSSSRRLHIHHNVLGLMFFDYPGNTPVKTVLDMKKYSRRQMLYESVLLCIFSSVLSEKKGEKRILPSLPLERLEEEVSGSFGSFPVGERLHHLLDVAVARWNVPERRREIMLEELFFQIKLQTFYKSL